MAKQEHTPTQSYGSAALFGSPKRSVVDISTQTIVKTIILLLLLWFVFLVREIIVALFFAFILASAINPLVDKLQERKIPRPLSVLTIFIGIIGFFSLLIALIIPPIAEQLIELAQQLPGIYKQLTLQYTELQHSIPPTVTQSLQDFLASSGDALKQGVQNTFGAISKFFGGFISLLTIFVLTFYITVEKDSVKKIVKSLFPKRHHAYICDVVVRAQVKMGAWVRGQLLLSLIIGLFVFIGLWILGVKYALVLAMLAGVMELVPIIGVIIAIIPALFLSVTQAPILAIGVLILYIVIQQLENHLIVPKVMQKAVGLNPVVIIISLLIGAKLAGILGVLMAVPTVTMLSVFIKDFTSHKVET